MHWILVAFGVICGTISFIVSIMEIIKAFSEEDVNTLPSATA